MFIENKLNNKNYNDLKILKISVIYKMKEDYFTNIFDTCCELYTTGN